MQVDETAAGTRLQVDEQGYRILRRAAETYRDELVLRLGAEVGLRPGEISRIRPADITTRQLDETDHTLLSVPGSDSEGRLAYVPEGVEHELRKYGHAEDVANDERYVPVTPRRVQMIVSEVGERAAETAGDDRFRQVSSRTLRRYFASHLLEQWVDPRVVKTVGGWDRLASLDPYVDEVSTDDVLRSFERLRHDEHTGDGAASHTAPQTRHGDTLDHFDQVLERVRGAGDAITTASTREEVERLTCEQLANGDPYEVAWIGEHEGETLTRRTQSGVDDGALQETSIPAAGAVQAALDETTVQTADDISEEPAFESLAGDDQSPPMTAAAVVPITDGNTTYGVIGIGARSTPGARERDVLTTLGRRLGCAITAVEQRKLLLADTVVELAFESRDEDSFFATVSKRFGCSLTLDGVVPGEEGTLLYFVTLTDAKPEQVLDWATTTDAVVDTRLVRDYGSEALLELVLDGSDCSKRLVERGATLREMTAENGTQRIVGDVSADADVRDVVDTLTEAFPATELVSKRERERPEASGPSFRSSLQETLTDKQAAVLQAAYYAGYFEWPRGSTAEELADAIGITSPTLHNHLRRAQQKLLGAFFDGEARRRDDTPWNNS